MKKFLILLFLLLISGCLLLSNGNSTQAASPASSPATGSGNSVSTSQLNPVPGATVPSVIGNAIKALLSVIGAIVLFTFIYGGMLILTSAGNMEKVKKGKDVLVWSIIGLAVIFASYLLVDFIIAGLTDTAPRAGGKPRSSPSP